MDAQRAARENANDLQEYMKGLSTWLSEIKVKDDALKKKGKSDRVLPPIRGTVSTPIATPTPTSQVTSSSASSSQNTENEVNKKLANEQKDLGNDFFKKEKFDEAIECYTKSMNLDPSNAIFPANRAMAYLKLKKYKQAESDCNLSVSIDPNYAKAYHRRATARQVLGRYKLAMADFEQVLKLDPASVQVKDEITKLEKLIAEKPTTSTTQTNTNPPPTQQKNNNNNNNDNKISSQTPTDPTTQKKEEITPKPVKKDNDTEKSAKKEEESKPVRKRMTITEVTEDETKNDATLTSTTTPSQQIPSPSKPIITEISSSSSTNAPAVIKPKIVPRSSIIPTLPSAPPKTFFEFERTWHSIKDFEDLSYSYLKLIAPKTFPTIVKESMSNELIYEILVILRNSLLTASPDFQFVAKFMKHLVRVGRFEMITMFFTRREKHILTEIFEKIQPYLKLQQAEYLKKLYGIN